MKTLDRGFLILFAAIMPNTCKFTIINSYISSSEEGYDTRPNNEDFVFDSVGFGVGVMRLESTTTGLQLEISFSSSDEF